MDIRSALTTGTGGWATVEPGHTQRPQHMRDKHRRRESNMQQTDRAKVLRDERRGRGECPRCGAPIDAGDGHVYCAGCRAIRNERAPIARAAEAGGGDRRAAQGSGDLPHVLLGAPRRRPDILPVRAGNVHPQGYAAGPGCGAGAEWIEQ